MVGTNETRSRGHARVRALGALWSASFVAAIAVAGACAEKKGALILAINTDMKAPKDVNAVSVTVSTNGAIKHSFIGRVTPDGDVLLPATLAIVQPDDENASIRIRVMAFQERKPRVLRDVKTTVPRDGRTALLRIPLNFVNDGSTKSAPLPDGVLPPSPSGGGGTGSGGGSAGGGAADFDFFGSFQPDCPDVENQTWIDGDCRDNAVDPGTLPDYEDTLVFGSGKDGADTSACFDVPACFQGAGPIQQGGSDLPPAPVQDGGTREMDVTPRAITLDRATCSIALNGADASQLNLAIVTPETGECVTPGECYIPLEQGASGWRLENGRVVLPSVTCKLLGKGLRLFQTAGKCRAKTEAQPICRPKALSPSNLQCANRSFDECGKCLVANCNAEASRCFGPDWSNGNFSGVCKPFLDCYCKGCTDPTGECKQCDGTMQADNCENCLQTNVETCLRKAGCKCGGSGDQLEGGTNDGFVSFSITRGDPPPSPDIGTTFTSSSVSVTNFPQGGPNARVANAQRGNGAGRFDVITCNTLTAGATFTRFRAMGTTCSDGNPDPTIVVDVPGAAGKGSAFWTSAQGTMRVISVSPLELQFENILMSPGFGAQEGGWSGTFRINGSGKWSTGSGGGGSSGGGP